MRKRSITENMAWVSTLLTWVIVQMTACGNVADSILESPEDRTQEDVHTIGSKATWVDHVGKENDQNKSILARKLIRKIAIEQPERLQNPLFSQADQIVRIFTNEEAATIGAIYFISATSHDLALPMDLTDLGWQTVVSSARSIESFYLMVPGWGWFIFQIRYDRATRWAGATAEFAYDLFVADEQLESPWHLSSDDFEALGEILIPYELIIN